MGAQLKVAILTNYPPDPWAISGGVATVAYHLVDALRHHNDLDLHVVHCHSEIPCTRTVMDHDLMIYFLSRPKHRIVPNLITGMKRVVGLLKQLKPDVVNAHTGPYALAGIRAGLPTVYTVHGVAHQHARVSRRLMDRLALLLEAHLDRLAVKDVRDIIAISPYVISQYAPLTRAAFHQIENPVPDAFFGVPNHEKPGRMLFVGVVAEDKGILTLLEALKLVVEGVPSAHVHIAGRILNERYFQYLADFTRRNALGDRVKFLGLLDLPALLREYAECSTLILPSRHENSPMVIREAMAAGKPVVATPVGGIRDLVRDGETGSLFGVGDAGDLAIRAVEILRDDGLRRSMGQRARMDALIRFRSEQVAERYRAVFLEVARG